MTIRTTADLGEGRSPETEVLFLHLFVTYMEKSKEAIRNGKEEDAEINPTIHVPKSFSDTLKEAIPMFSKKGKIERVFDGICSEIFEEGIRAIHKNLLKQSFAEVKDSLPDFVKKDVEEIIKEIS